MSSCLLTMPRKGWCLVTSLVMGALLLLPAGTQAQSLSDIAAKERERRKALGKASRTFTDQDLRVGRPEGDVAAGVRAPAVPKTMASAAGAAKEEEEVLSEEDERQDRLEAWRQMLQDARDDVARLSAEADRLQASLNALSGLYGSERADRMSQLEKAKQGLAAARRVLEDIEDLGQRHAYR